MASVTQVHKRRKNNKLKNLGKARKRMLRSKGSTPSFKIHPEPEKE